jgi:nitroreductase
LDFFDVVLSQRAHRALRPDPVPDDLIEQVLEAAVHAPSAENRQPWAFVVVRDPAQREAIASLTAATWEGGAREHLRPNLAPGLMDDVDRWATGGLAAAPVHVVVGGDTSLAPEMLLPSSVYPAVQNLLLAALAVGLGSLMSTLSIASGPAFRRLLGLPDHIVPLALVPLGYPARPLGPPRREPFAGRTYRDRWGQAW